MAFVAKVGGGALDNALAPALNAGARGGAGAARAGSGITIADQRLLNSMPMGPRNSGAARASDDLTRTANVEAAQSREQLTASLRAFSNGGTAAGRAGANASSQVLAKGGTLAAAKQAFKNAYAKVSKGAASPVTQLMVYGSLMLVPFLYGIGKKTSYPAGVDPNDPMGLAGILGPLAPYAQYIVSSLIWGCSSCVCLVLVVVMMSSMS